MSDTDIMIHAEAIPRVATFTDRDDRFHFDEIGNGWWATETAWFSFVVPERNMGGWLYTMVRPTIGTVAGGVWVWDDTAVYPWQVPYSRNLAVMPLDRSQDLDRIDLANSVSITTVKPRMVYDLAFSDPGKLELDLRFAGTMEPFGLENASVNGAHFDQVGRMSGEIVLRGESIKIDCLSVRDRSWGERREDIVPHVAYITGIGDEQNSFLAITDTHREGIPIYGYIQRDGEVAPVVSGRRTDKRDPHHGWISSITVELKDTLGRELRAEGRPASRIIIDRRSFIDCNSLVEWSYDGFTSAWGEDQDLWSMHDWPGARRL